MKKKLFNPCVRDRTKDFFVLRMKSGNYRFICNDKEFSKTLPTKEQAPHGYTILNNEGYHNIYDAIKTDEYIQLTRYYAGGSTCSYQQFVSSYEQEGSPLQHKSIGNTYNSVAELKNYEQYFNIRFYKDGSVAVIASIKLPNGKVRSFQIDFTFNIYDWYRLSRALMDKLNIPLTTSLDIMNGRWGSWLQNREDWYQETKSEKIMREVFYEEDIVPEFIQMKNLVNTYNSLFPSREDTTFFVQPDKKIKVWEESLTLPSEFKDFFVNCKGALREQVYKNASSKLRDPRKELTAAFLVSNATVSLKYLKNQTAKIQNNATLWEKYYDKELCRVKGQGVASINRIDNLIVISTIPQRDAYRKPYLCLFDTVKKQKQIYVKENKLITRVPLFAATVEDIASYIATSCCVNYCKEPEEIFKGTLLDWIVTNAKNKTLPAPEQALKACIQKEGHWMSDNRYTYTYTRLEDWLSKDVYNDRENRKYSFNILFRENLLLEQLCKCGLWNLFARSLDNIQMFTSKDCQLEYSESDLIYNPKSKSLTNSLGLSMKQLQYIDAIYNVSDTDKHLKSVRIPTLLSAFSTTLKEIKALDFNTFTKLINFALYTSRGRSFATRLLRHENFFRLIYSMTLTQKISFCYKYRLYELDDATDEWSDKYLMYYTDYLQFRSEAKNLLANLAAINENEREAFRNFDQQWPLLPEACTVFLRYFPGVMLSAARYSVQCAGDEDQFKNIVLQSYPKEVCEWITDAKKNLSGVVLHLSAAEHVILLHDEISVWLREKNDAQIADLFAAASLNAKRYEYINKDFGLQIVAPTKPDDLRNEGSVLSHCVGGYVQAMAHGNNTILFIRRTDYPQHPYFTLDLAKGEVRQIHCYRNGNPTASDIQRAYAESKYEVYDSPKDIIGFLLEWAKHVSGVSAKSIRTNYGNLCAL